MDNRTDFRKPRGPAFLAEQARRALVLPHEIHELGDVPLPLVHTALGVALCAIAVLVRPQAVGLRSSVVFMAVLSAAMVMAFTIYDRLVYEPGVRPGIEGSALPIAALAAFQCVLAASIGWHVRLGSAVGASLIIGGVPHLAGLRAAGREGTAGRLVRDAAGVAALLPVMLVGVTPMLQWWSRGALVLVCVTLVTFDSLRTEGMHEWVALATAMVVAWIVAAASALVDTVGASGNVRAPALLLVLWYSLRGLCGSYVVRPRRVAHMAEYVIFAGAAVALIQWMRR
ncbi:MAG: hypothetical protein ABR564_08935 [Candidatus Dormibacteria bacterium]